MNPNLPPFIYNCKNCGADFYLKHKAIVIRKNLFSFMFKKSFTKGETIGPECPNCGSHNTDLNRLVKM